LRKDSLPWLEISSYDDEMKPSIILTILMMFTLSTQLLAKESVIDLGPINHKFVEAGIEEERHHLTNQAEWQKFWKRFSDQPEPKVDFKNSDLLIFLMGTKGSGGYSVQIQSVEKKKPADKQSDQVARVLLCVPNANEDQTMELTSPSAAKLIPKSQGKIIWETKQQVTGTKDCR